jgi:outer membrane protein
VRLDQAFSLSGRELIALKIAGQNVARSQDDLTALREEYLLRVAAAYFDTLLLSKDFEIAAANVDRLTQYRQAAEKRQKVGEVTKTVLLRADAELSGAKSDRLRATNAQELAMAVLARVAGIEGPYTIKEEAPVQEEVPSLETLQATAFAQRADLKSQEMAKVIAGEQVRFTRGAFWPSISFLGGYSSYDQHPDYATLNRESVFGNVSLNFLLFEGGLRKSEVKEAQARERQTGYLYDDLRKSIAIEVEGAYLAYLTQKGTLKFVDDQVLFARDNYRGVVRQFESGLASSLDVIDANTALVSAERTAATAYYRYQLAWLRLLRATGEFMKGAVKSRS